MKNVFFTVLFALVAFQTAAQRSGAWEIERDWTADDERAYSQFIADLGESGCNTTTRCINSKANPYRHLNPDSLKSYVKADCADLPYVLRAYFAYMNKLPFSWTNKFTHVKGSGDIRYSKYGNKPTSRRVVSPGENVKTILSEVTWISSGVFRMPPELDVNGQIFPDFYSPKVSQKSIRPGTIVYDPNGHVAIIYRVEKNGRIHLMDAHPDNTISRIVYGEKFVRTRPAAGAGFKNWRPVTYNSNHPVAKRNSDVSDFNLEQYYGTNPSNDSWSAGKFVINGQTLGYYDYVRVALAGGNLRYDPIEEFEAMLTAVCNDLIDRAHAIDTGLESGIHRKPHPTNLPDNIYGTHGEWESYSTPSRDARLKTSFVEMRKYLERFVSMADAGSDRLDFAGTGADLKATLIKIYDADADQCRISYTRSNGATQELSLEEVENRLWKLSFDPYHCIEYRWGATDAELSSCNDDATKRAWYDAEQRLRNQIDRTYDTKMGFSLAQLRANAPGSGVDNPPVVNIREFLRD
ncbi:hypothetical protein GW915_11055 [bacterium]|nr:hypothetical protein [bacterium]